MACCSDVKPGDLKYLITVHQKSNSASDGLGGYTKSWAALGQTRAKITFSSAKDRVTGEVLVTASEAQAMIRSNVPMQKGYRIDVAGFTGQYECIGLDPENPMSDFKKAYFRRVEHEKV